MKKTCSECEQEKLLEDFHSSGYYTLADGTKMKSYKPDCKECANVKWQKRYFARLHKVLEDLGRELKCECCEYDEHPVGLDFHHTDPTQKDFTIASRWTISEEKLREEIEKCQILCALCHRLKHAGIF